MNENNTVLENASLFLNLDQAVPRLAERISLYEHSSVLMVVICQEAMPVANQIAGALGLNLIFSAIDPNTKTTESQVKDIPVDFDYDTVKESSRDIPQDFIVHQEQNLRTNLKSIYTEIYESLTRKHPDKLIILVDQLTNINAAFFPCLTQKYTDHSGGNSFSMPAIRKFVFLYVSSVMKRRESQSHKVSILLLDTFIK
jgi:hypothetical protein